MQGLWGLVAADEWIYSVESAGEGIIPSCTQIVILRIDIKMFPGIEQTCGLLSTFFIKNRNFSEKNVTVRPLMGT